MKTYLKYNNITVECFPKNALKLSYKKNDDEVFLRRELVESLIFVDDEVNNHFDYSNIINQISCTEFIFSIPDKDFKATFFITDCTVDEYRKTILVKPITLDEYTAIDNVIDNEVNVAINYSDSKTIIIENAGYQIHKNSFSIDKEKFAELPNTYPLPRPPEIDEIIPTYGSWVYGYYVLGLDTYSNTDIFNYRLYKWTWIRKSGDIYWSAQLEYRRETIVSDAINVGSGWTYFGDVSTDSDLKIWSRPYGGNEGVDIISQYSEQQIIGSATDDFDEKYVYTLIYEPPLAIYNTEIKSYSFIDFIEKYLLPNGISIESDFFNLEINPIANLLGLNFSTKYLYVSILSNFSYELAGILNYDRATISIITLKQFLDYLYSQFRVRWDMHNGKLRLEHEYFYENQLCYNIPNNISKIVNFQNHIYSFNNNEINNIFEYGYENTNSDIKQNVESVLYKPGGSYDYSNNGKYTEFNKHILTYTSNNISCVKSKNKVEKENIELFFNNINYMLYDWNAIKKTEGFVLLHCDINNKLIYTRSEYDESIIPNGYLSILSSIKLFYTICGYYKHAEVTSKDYRETIKFYLDILKLKRVKIQRDIMINSSDFRTDYTYITPIGQGVVEEAEEDLDNGTVNLTLLYD